MSISIYETERLARTQGFYFCARLHGCDQLGHVMWHTVELARADGQRTRERQSCRGFKIFCVALNAPFTSYEVDEG